MKAARLVEPGRLECEDVAEPTLDGVSEPVVLVRTLRASICGSDVHTVFHDLYPGAFPAPAGYPGHEAVSEVVASTAEDFAAGDRVLCVPDPLRSTAFADLQLIPPAYLIPLERDGDLDLVLAQQLGTVIYALRRFWPPERGPAACAAVLGAGSAGLFFAQLLRAMGFERVVVSDRHEHRRAAAQRAGAHDAVRPGELATAVKDATGGRGADLVVEAAGYDAARAEAIDALRVDGRLGLFGLPESPGDAPVPFNLLFRKRASVELTWDAQHEPGLVSFREALDALRDGRVHAVGMITHRYGLEQIAEAFAHALDGGDGALKLAVET